MADAHPRRGFERSPRPDRLDHGADPRTHRARVRTPWRPLSRGILMPPVQLQKAFLKTETNLTIECMFNPERFAFSMSNRWESNRIPGKSTPSLRYAGGESGSFALSLVF